MPVEPIIFIKYDPNAPPTSDARSYIRGYAKKLKGTRTDEGYSAKEYDDAFKFNTWPTAGKFMSIANNQADVTAWKNSNPINAQKEINMSKGNNFSSSSIKIQYRKDKRDEVIKFLIGANIRWSDLGDNFMKITSLDNISVESKISGMPLITHVHNNFSSKFSGSPDYKKHEEKIVKKLKKEGKSNKEIAEICSAEIGGTWTEEIVEQILKDINFSSGESNFSVRPPIRFR